MADRLHLQPRHRRMLESLLREHLPEVEVWAYGSRVTGLSHDGSDLDLVLRGPGLGKIPIGQLADFEEAVRESNIPFLVEARDWARLPERFHAEIEQNYVVVIAKADGGANALPWRDLPFSEAVLINPYVSLKRGNVYPHVDMALLTPGARSVKAVANREFRGGGSRFEPGDTLMARITPCLENGKTARFEPSDPYENGPAHGSTEFIVLRGQKPITDTGYVHYLAKSPEVRNFAIGQMTGTSGRQRVPPDCFDHLSVSIPPIAEQCAIAHILGALDDRIELNGRMNETLEAIARALFKSWFVDFEPVRAKMAWRGTGLADQIADLFPSTFDNEHNPHGWSRVSLAALADVNPESWSSSNVPEEVEYVDLANTKWGAIESTQRFRWQDAPSRARRILRPGDTIIGTVRPGNGSFAFIGNRGLTGSTGFAVLRPYQRRYRAFVYLAATAPENIERLTHLADGAAYPAVRPQVVGATQAVVADQALVDVFSDLASPVLDHIHSNKEQNRALAQIRDILLPKLISGEISIADAETAVGAVA